VVYDHLNDPSGASAYFNAVTGQVGAWFHACGLEGTVPVWPEGAHPCMPLSEWKRFFRATIHKPYEHDLFSRRELFDLRELSGDRRSIQGCGGRVSHRALSPDRRRYTTHRAIRAREA